MNDFAALGYIFETSVIAAVRKFEARISYHDFAIQKIFFALSTGSSKFLKC